MLSSKSSRFFSLFTASKGLFIYYVCKMFRKTNISYSLIRTRAWGYQRSKFSQKFSKIGSSVKFLFLPSSLIAFHSRLCLVKFCFLPIIWLHHGQTNLNHLQGGGGSFHLWVAGLDL